MANRRSMSQIIQSGNAKEMILGKNHTKDIYQILNAAETQCKASKPI